MGFHLVLGNSLAGLSYLQRVPLSTLAIMGVIQVDKDMLVTDPYYGQDRPLCVGCVGASKSSLTVATYVATLFQKPTACLQPSVLSSSPPPPPPTARPQLCSFFLSLPFLLRLTPSSCAAFLAPFLHPCLPCVSQVPSCPLTFLPHPYLSPCCRELCCRQGPKAQLSY